MRNSLTAKTISRLPSGRCAVLITAVAPSPTSVLPVDPYFSARSEREGFLFGDGGGFGARGRGRARWNRSGLFDVGVFGVVGSSVEPASELDESLDGCRTRRVVGEGIVSRMSSGDDDLSST